MGRVLGGQKNTLTITDNLSGSEIELYYRMPAASERLAYSAMAVQRKGDKIEFKTQETRLHYGNVILTGFRDGDFARVKDGKERPISCNADSPDYYPEWRELLNKYATDALETLAVFVFEASVSRKKVDAPEPAPPPPADTPAPDDAPGN